MFLVLLCFPVWTIWAVRCWSLQLLLHWELISLFRPNIICFMKCCILALGAYRFTMLYFLVELVPCSLYSDLLCLFLQLLCWSLLSEVSIAVAAHFWFCLCGIFFPSLDFPSVSLLQEFLVSSMSSGLGFLIHSVHLYPLIAEFTSFTLKVILDKFCHLNNFLLFSIYFLFFTLFYTSTYFQDDCYCV